MKLILTPYLNLGLFAFLAGGCIPAISTPTIKEPQPMKIGWFKAPSKVTPDKEFKVNVKYFTSSRCDEVFEARAEVQEDQKQITLSGKVGPKGGLGAVSCEPGTSFGDTELFATVSKRGTYKVTAIIYATSAFGAYDHFSPPLTVFQSLEPYVVFQEIVSG